MLANTQPERQLVSLPCTTMVLSCVTLTITLPALDDCMLAGADGSITGSQVAGMLAIGFCPHASLMDVFFAIWRKTNLPTLYPPTPSEVNFSTSSSRDTESLQQEYQ